MESAGDEADETSGVTMESPSHYCFLCLTRPKSDELSNYSLKYLTRYLNLDTRESGSAKKTNTNRSTDVRDRLEVALCENCSLINQDFLDHYRQLQQIELGMMYCLQRLQAKLVNAEKPRSRMADQLETIMTIRKKVIKSCSSKLTDILANAKELIAEAVNVEKRKVNPNTKVTINTKKVAGLKKPTRSEILEDPLDPSTESETGVKLEPQEDDDAHDLSELEYMESEASSSDRSAESEDESGLSTNSASGRNKNGINEREQVCDTKLPPVVIIPKEAPQPKSAINPATGKHICNLCPKEFDTTTRFQVHFNALHAKLKYNCSLCGLSFSQKGSFDRHHLNLHMGVRFSCPTCDQTFTEKCSINKHQRKTGCGGTRDRAMGTNKEKVPPLCHLCGKGFTRKNHLDNHLKSFHSKERSNLCDICGKTFKLKGSLYKHRKRFHPGMGGGS